MKSRLITLNLIYDYPVEWSRYKVLRDLVQNFYDSVKHTEWHERFSYKVEDRELILKTKKVSFSYDWLIHIGASTKRDDPGEYAGYFGEGFKIASLCALRDHDWHIEMASQDWHLTVTTNELEVDGRYLTSLAYKVKRTKKSSKHTILRIYPFFGVDNNILDSVLCSFFYHQNPLFGKKIWSSKEAAVYHRSNHPKPYQYPSTYDYSGPGIIFAGYQALGSFNYPLVFCLHTYRLNDRERNTFYRMDVVKVIKYVVSQLPPQAATEVLEILQNKWYKYPKKKYDFDTWYPIIKNLTTRIAISDEEKKRWQQKYPNLLVAHQVKRTNLSRYNRRRQALDWSRSSNTTYRLVQDGFSALGYPSLEEICEEHDGFTLTREANKQESEMIALLESLAKILLVNIFSHVEIPPCKIIKHSNAVWTGMANCIPLSPPIKVSSKLRIRYKLPYIALKKYLFAKDMFGSALSTYLHEITHIFGGDSSASFSHALTELLTITLSNTKIIELYREKWEEIAPTDDNYKLLGD